MTGVPIVKWREIIEYLLMRFMNDTISRDDFLKYLEAVLTLRQIL